MDYRSIDLRWYIRKYAVGRFPDDISLTAEITVGYWDGTKWVEISRRAYRANETQIKDFIAAATVEGSSFAVLPVKEGQPFVDALDSRMVGPVNAMASYFIATGLWEV